MCNKGRQDNIQYALPIVTLQKWKCEPNVNAELTIRTCLKLSLHQQILSITLFFKLYKRVSLKDLFIQNTTSAGTEWTEAL